MEHVLQPFIDLAFARGQEEAWLKVQTLIQEREAALEDARQARRQPEKTSLARSS